MLQGLEVAMPGTRNSCVDLKALVRKLGSIHPDHQRIFKGAFRVAVFLLLGKAAGAIKEMAVAYRYGVSDAWTPTSSR